jgi:hypothetical protein
MSRFTPTADAVSLRWVGRYYRRPDTIGYSDRAAAESALADAVSAIGPGGSAVSVNGRDTTFVGFSHAKRDPNYLGFIPRVLVRSDSGDIFVSIYDLD